MPRALVLSAISSSKITAEQQGSPVSNDQPGFIATFFLARNYRCAVLVLVDVFVFVLVPVEVLVPFLVPVLVLVPVCVPVPWADAVAATPTIKTKLSISVITFVIFFLLSK